MAFADPQSITINSVTTSLPRVSSGVNQGGFLSNDGTIAFKVSHSYGKRIRRSVRVDVAKIAPDPLISANNIRYSASVFLVVDQPITGFTVTELQQILTGFRAQLAASSDADIIKLLGGEN